MLLGCGRVGYDELQARLHNLPGTDAGRGGAHPGDAGEARDGAATPDASTDFERDGGIVTVIPVDAGPTGYGDAAVTFFPTDAGVQVCDNLVNCDFSSGLSGWTTYVSEETGGSISFEDGALVVRRDKNASQGAMRLRQDDLPLSGNQTYLLEFDGRVASGTKSVWFFLYYDNDDGVRSNYCGANLDTTMRRYSCAYSVGSHDAYGFGMDFGGESNTADIVIDNIGIVPM
jgi:hypothetical protein